MKLSQAETNALIADHAADVAWLEWVRAALRRARYVRLDVSPGSLSELPRLVEIAPGLTVRRGETECA